MAARLDTDVDLDYPTDGLRPAASVSRFVEIGSLRLHYLDYGTPGRPPMLCVHGGAAHAHWYDFVAPGLSANHHLLSLDHRGHGASQWAESEDYSYESFASDLAAVVEKLDLRDFVLVGHSMGGMISLVYAATHPGRVARLVIVDSTMKMTRERVGRLREVGMRQPSTYATRKDLITRYRLQPGGTTASPEMVRYLAYHSCRQAADGSWQHKFDRNVYAKRERMDGMACWDNIRVPALLLGGGLSDRITPEIFAEIKARCPHAEFAQVPNSYHHVMVDNPAGFERAVQAFLARHP